MRRILLILTVAALMVAMVVANASPAFAQEVDDPIFDDPEDNPGQSNAGPSEPDVAHEQADGGLEFFCVRWPGLRKGDPVEYIGCTQEEWDESTPTDAGPEDAGSRPDAGRR